MHFFNHHSAPIVAALLLAGGLSRVVRRGGKMRHRLKWRSAGQLDAVRVRTSMHESAN